MDINLQYTVPCSVEYITVYCALQCRVHHSIPCPTVYSSSQYTVPYSVQFITVYRALQCRVHHSILCPAV